LSAFIFAFAGEYGTIKGKVFEEETNIPLNNAIVFLEGTELGTKTDTSGNYIFPFVYIGSYRLRVYCMGYYITWYTEVIVHTDQSTVLNFSLRPNVIDDDILLYKAKPQLIIFSQTSSAQVYTAKDIERYLLLGIE
jgi:hypothetical protein